MGHGLGLAAVLGIVRVILTSGYNEQDATNGFTGKGLAGFIQKPYRLRALLEIVQRVLDDSPRGC